MRPVYLHTYIYRQNRFTVDKESSVTCRAAEVGVSETRTTWKARQREEVDDGTGEVRARVEWQRPLKTRGLEHVVRVQDVRHYSASSFLW